jgi:chromosome segregation ATPase
MSALADRRTRTEMSIEGCTSRINNLQIEIAKLEAKIDALTMALNESARRGLGL